MKIVTLLFILFLGITGNTVSDDPFSGGVPDSEIECMENCIGEYCTIGDVECAEPYTDGCMDECGAVMPEQTEDEQCVQECLYSNCGEFDWDCQDSYYDTCDLECGLRDDEPLLEDMSEEEICIMECVARYDPSLICGASAEGETGNDICQQCSNECVYLYAGPCLNDEEISQKESECETCEHCYGSLVMGDSGEGYECIVDIECSDASGEFGDDPGASDDDESSEESYEDIEEKNIIENVIDWFSSWF